MTEPEPQNAPADAPFDTEAVLRATAEKLRGMLDSIKLAGSGEHGSTVRDVARISTALTQTCAELRQHAKAALREVAKIPLEQIMAHLKSLPSDVREQLSRELVDADAEEPLL